MCQSLIYLEIECSSYKLQVGLWKREHLMPSIISHRPGHHQLSRLRGRFHSRDKALISISEFQQTPKADKINVVFAGYAGYAGVLKFKPCMLAGSHTKPRPVGEAAVVVHSNTYYAG